MQDLVVLLFQFRQVIRLLRTLECTLTCTCLVFPLGTAEWRMNCNMLQELEDLAAAHPDRLHLWFTLEQPPDSSSSTSTGSGSSTTTGSSSSTITGSGGSTGPWRYSQGFITVDMMAQHLLPAGEGSIALMCGPPAMLERVVMPGLAELGFKADTQMVVF
jgi:ferredoxin-NADP reductase